MNATRSSSPLRPVPNNGTPSDIENSVAEEAEFRYEILRSRVLSPDQLAKLPPPVPLIEDYFVRDTVVTTFGRPGTAKSLVAMSQAFAIVTGTPWFGHEVVQGNVLYIAAEGSAGLAQRQRAWREVCGYPALTGMHWLPMAVNLLDTTWVSALVRLVEELQPVFVVIDTVARSMSGGDENSSSDMSALVAAADRIREACGATVDLVHHTPKEGSTPRGHSSFEGAVDTSLLLERNVNSITLTMAKQKDLPTLDPLVFELTSVGSSVVLMLSHEGRETSVELVESERRVRQAVWDNCETDGLPATTLLELSGVSKPSFYRAIKSLRTKGIIRNVGSDKRARWAAIEDLDAASVSRSLTESHGFDETGLKSRLISPPLGGVRHETSRDETSLFEGQEEEIL